MSIEKPSPSGQPSDDRAAQLLAAEITRARTIEAIVPLIITAAVSSAGAIFGLAIAAGAHDNASLAAWWHQYSWFAILDVLLGGGASVGLGALAKALGTYNGVKPNGKAAQP